MILSMQATVTQGNDFFFHLRKSGALESRIVKLKIPVWLRHHLARPDKSERSHIHASPIGGLLRGKAVTFELTYWHPVCVLCDGNYHYPADSILDTEDILCYEGDSNEILLPTAGPVV